jgi:chromodomain-helicase-DNA-binding protein 7
MLHGGLPLKPDGEYDWGTFRELCGFPEKTDEQMEKFVDAMMNVTENEEQPDEEKEEKDEKDDKDDKDGGTAITAARIKQRLVSLTGLRRLFLKFSEQDLSEYFSYLPRWRNVPRGWTNQMEFVFFQEISTRGWGVCGEILKLPAFDGVFEGDPPTFVTLDARVIRRLDFILQYIDQNGLETLRQREAGRPKRKEKVPTGDLVQIPDIAYDELGQPAMPIALTSTAYVCSLGRIITDRTGFHTERYIYPAGYTSSRMYASTLDPTQRVRYTSEILDVGDQMPLFRVTMDERPDVYYEGNSPTSPWNLIVKRILELRVDNPRALSVSGPDFYGLACPTICYLIQQMEGADMCVNYIMRPFAPPGIKRMAQPKPAKPPLVRPPLLTDADRPPPAAPQPQGSVQWGPEMLKRYTDMQAASSADQKSTAAAVYQQFCEQQAAKGQGLTPAQVLAQQLRGAFPLLAPTQPGQAQPQDRSSAPPP